MKIKLQGIGIIKDSEIELNGLTVITGDNNSGKTTVGKVVYSLFDAVSNLAEKAEEDKNDYAWEILKDIRDDIGFLSILFMSSEKSNQSPSTLSLFFSKAFFANFKNNSVSYAYKIYDEIKEFYEIGLSTLDDEDRHYLYKKTEKRYFDSTRKDYSVEDYIKSQLKFALKSLDELFEKLDGDSQLTNYARNNISGTLLTEFRNQIQPVRLDVEKSTIAVEDKKMCFYLDIVNNNIVRTDEPVYYGSSIKKAFFVDNPFVLDFGYRSGHDQSDRKNNDSFFNKYRINPHEFKLNNFLRNNDISVFETNILEKQFKEINAKINEVISGDFEFTNDGDYYIDKGRKLRFSNLATGSKLFSIIKLLINKGALTESTVLVLDEPEAHLHPAWQNKFAEIIVMLVKELNVKVLLTSHSPNFVLAIDAFMRKYEINNKTNFYQTQLMEDGSAEYKNVNKDMGMIYSDFVQYLTEVKLLRDLYYRGAEENDDQ